MLVLEDLDHAMPHVADAQELVGEEGSNSINKTQVFRDMLHMARGRQAHVLVLVTARNRQGLNKELLSSQGRHTFDRVLEIHPPTLVRGEVFVGRACLIIPVLSVRLLVCLFVCPD